jgi:hypothetical protein
MRRVAITGMGVFSPEYYVPYFLLGRIVFECGQPTISEDYLKKASALYPAYLSEQGEIQDLLSRIGAKEGRL